MEPIAEYMMNRQTIDQTINRVLEALILLLAFSLFPAEVSAETNFFTQKSFTPSVSYLPESENLNSLAKAIQHPPENWKSVDKSSLNLGYTNQPHWIRFTTQGNPIQSQNQLIEIAYPHLDKLSIYQTLGNTTLKTLHTGDHLPFKQRAIDHAHFLFPMDSPTAGDTTFFIRVETSGTLQLPIKIWDTQSFFEGSIKIEQAHAAYYGILLVIIIFNLVIYTALREINYLYYCLSTLGYLALIATLRGKTFQVIWPNWPQVQEMVMLISIPFALIFSMMFSRSFLALQKNNRTYDQILKIVTGLSVLSLLCSFILPYHFSIQLSVALAVPGCLLLLIVGPVQWFRGQRAAKLYSVAWALLTTGGTLAALNKAGVIPINFVTEYAVEIGSALEAIILSVALAERLYREREDKVKAQASTIKEHNERRNAELTIIRQALTHPVTQLPNFAHFEMCVNNWISQENDTPFAIVLVKISNFNEINNTLGYGNADKLLQQLALRVNKLAEEAPGVRILEKTASKNFYASSFEGASFAIALELESWEANRKKLKSFLTKLSAPTEFSGMVLELPAHIGTSNFPEDGEDANTLIRRANVAVEHAHQYENHLSHYRPHQDPYNAKKLTLITELKRAIQENLLELYVQPKIDLESMEVIGLESLLRWQHPSFGFIPPDEFVIVAEQTGIIKPLTRWVLRQALIHIKSLEEKGISLNMSINISPNNLKESDFTIFVHRLLTEFGIEPKQIILELTETSMMADPLKALDALNHLHNTGVNLSIDDFGTGYSSLSYIKKLPAREIKIDKSLILELDKMSDDQVIVKTTINMCHDLGFKVVAEGVETEDVQEKLITMGCDQVQGYWFTKPLPLSEFVLWLADYQAKLPAKQLRADGA